MMTTRPAAITLRTSALLAGALLLMALPSRAHAAAPQESAAVFDAPLVVIGDQRRFEHVLDLDGDGDMDAVGWWWQTSGSSETAVITGWANDGNGVLTETLEVLIGSDEDPTGGPAAMQVGNLDGNALDDFAVAFSNGIWLYASNGAAAPTELSLLTHTAPITEFALGDFNADGIDDVVFYDDIRLNIWLNDGLGNFAEASTVGADLDGPLHVVDANGDTTDDLMAHLGQGIKFWTFSNGVLLSQSHVVTGLGANPAQLPVAGDVDGDGDEDVTVFQEDSGDYALLRRTGVATFSVEAPTVGGPATNLADYDGDGDLDGLCCGGGGGTGHTVINGQPSTFMVALNDGSGGFAPAWTLEGLGAHHLAGAVDMDADGDIDLVAGRVIYYNRGSVLGLDEAADAPIVQIADHALLTRHGSDADGDGDIDLEFSTTTLSRNLADGRFESVPVLVPAPPGNTSWRGPGYQADWDGDGDVDLLVSMTTGSYFGATVFAMRLLENNGAGVLFDAGNAGPLGMFVHVKALSFPDGYWADTPDRAVIADADGDGDLDLLSRAIEDGADTPAQTKLFWNDGSGFFTEGPVFDGENIQLVADLNNDQLPDLVTVGGNLGVRLGQGGKTFGPFAQFGVGNLDAYQDVVGSGDLDGDGDLDLVNLTGVLTLYVNDGNGVFTPDVATFAGHQGISGSGDGYYASAVDVDDDGVLDVVAGGVRYAENSSYVFRGLPGGGFADAVIQVLRPSGWADVDGDGDLDALAHDVTHELFEIGVASLVLNQTHAGPTVGMRQQYGTASTGGGGTAPVLGASGPFRTGELVNFHVTGLPAGELGVFTVGLAASDLPNTPWPQVQAYNWPWIFFLLLSGSGPDQLPNDAGFTLPYNVDSNIVGLPLSFQAIFDDDEGPKKRIHTNGLLVEFGP